MPHRKTLLEKPDFAKGSALAVPVAAAGHLQSSRGAGRAPAAPAIPKVGLFIESSRASGRGLLHGIARFIHHSGPWSVYWEPGGLEKAWPQLKSLRLKGIIARDVNRVEQVVALGIPAVVVGHSRTEIPGLVNVVTDSETIGQMAAEHLLGCGFQNFAYCGFESLPLAPWSLSRKSAFIRRIQQAGWECQVYAPLPQRRRSWHQEMGGLVRWLRSISTPCGLMACNDDRGEQVLEACRIAQLPVPSAIAVIGVDNDEVVCGLSNPPLSSVGMDFVRAGFEAAEALSKMIAGQRDVPAVINVSATHVVARRSTEVIAVDDPNLAKALQFIRDQNLGATPVAAVARCAGLSRRALEKRFRNVLGRSVLQEIRRVRTDRIAQLLVETDLPVARIADLLGFTDPHHVARYFRTAKRLSPAAYRKAYGGKEWCAQIGDLFAQNGVVHEGQKGVLA